MKISLEQIENIIKLAKKYNLQEFYYEEEDNWKLKLKFKKRVSLKRKSKNADIEKYKKNQEHQNLVTIYAPLVGTFYRAPSPQDKPYIQVGDRVKVGQVICIIEAMKLMNEIESEVDGIVRKILVEDGQPVEYGQPLFLIEVD